VPLPTHTRGTGIPYDNFTYAGLPAVWFECRGPSFTNVALHTIAVLLLFRVLRGTTGALWPSALVAALFAIHPLHVESVAWLSERKDVLERRPFYAHAGKHMFVMQEHLPSGAILLS